MVFIAWMSTSVKSLRYLKDAQISETNHILGFGVVLERCLFVGKVRECIYAVDENDVAVINKLKMPSSSTIYEYNNMKTSNTLLFGEGGREGALKRL